MLGPKQQKVSMLMFCHGICTHFWLAFKIYISKSEKFIPQLTCYSFCSAISNLKALWFQLNAGYISCDSEWDSSPSEIKSAHFHTFGNVPWVNERFTVIRLTNSSDSSFNMHVFIPMTALAQDGLRDLFNHIWLRDRFYVESWFCLTWQKVFLYSGVKYLIFSTESIK